MADNNLELATLPTYDGRSAEQIGKSGMTAENFLARMDAFTATLPVPADGDRDTQRINRTANQLRGSAATWWTYVAGAHARNFGLDKARMHAEWDYFTQQFKTRFFAVQDNVDVVADISDIKQMQGELPQQYVERLGVTIGAVNDIWEEQTISAITAPANMDAHMPAALINYLADAVNNPLDAAQLRAHITTAIREGAKHYVRHHTTAQGFIQVCRSVGRNATDERVRSRALKLLQENPEPSFQLLINAVRQEDKAHRRPANQARPVSHVEEAGAGYDPHNPVSAAGNFRGRGRGRGGRGRGGNNQRDNGLYCTWCKRKNHDANNCRTLQAHIDERDGDNRTVNSTNSAQSKSDAPRNNRSNNRSGQKSKPKKVSQIQSNQDSEDNDDEADASQNVGALNYCRGSPYAPGN